MLQDDGVQVAFRSCEEILFKSRLTSAAKAAIDFAALMARLEAAPLQNLAAAFKDRGGRRVSRGSIVQLVGRTKGGQNTVWFTG
jgi:hypothetical protein